MSDIIPRKRAVPVQARRAEIRPETIHVPGEPPIPVPPPQAGVTQNIFYVNIPPAQPVPPPPPSRPPDIHFHNTNVYQAPRNKRREIGVSFFGLWALVFAAIAAVISYVPPVIWLAKPIVEIGVICAVVGFLGALLLGRVGRGVPLFALLMCGVAYFMYLNNSGQLPGKFDQLQKMSPIALPKMSFDGKPDSTAKDPNPPAAAPATAAPPQPAQDPSRLHDQTIFGDGQGTWVKPTPSPAAKAAQPVPSSPAPATPPPAAVPSIDVATARANLEQARTAAARQMGVDYGGAKTAAAEATSEYEDAKIGDAPGSPELIAASQKHLEADSRLNAIEIKLRSDPAVAAAEAVLKTATPSK